MTALNLFSVNFLASFGPKLAQEFGFLQFSHYRFVKIFWYFAWTYKMINVKIWQHWFFFSVNFLAGLGQRIDPNWPENTFFCNFLSFGAYLEYHLQKNSSLLRLLRFHNNNGNIIIATRSLRCYTFATLLRLLRCTNIRHFCYVATIATMLRTWDTFATSLRCNTSESHLSYYSVS